MGLFHSKGPSINEGLRLFHETKDAVLLDVRGEEEYAKGHIPGSVNLPLQHLDDAEDVIPDYDKEIFTYCLSGKRSTSAMAALKAMGYTHVTNIGGIQNYHGEIEK